MENILTPNCPKTQEILNLFQQFGHLHFIEDMTVLSHAFQAGILARERGLDGDMIVAALLHDIGHLIPFHEELFRKLLKNAKMQSHDILGADYLASLGFSQAIVATCRNHIRAKRYLCFKHDAYFDRLSEESKEKLELQGGPMSLAEAMAFEADPYFHISLEIRQIDIEARVKAFQPTKEDWKYFAHMIEIHLA